MRTLADPLLSSPVFISTDEASTWPHVFLLSSLQAVIINISSCRVHPAKAMPLNGLMSACLQAKCSWGNEPPNGAWQSAHALVTLAGQLADVLADADRTAAGSSAAAAGSSAAAAAQPAAAAGTAADAYPACGDRPSTEAEDCAARRGYTAAVGQPVLDELVGNAVTGAVVVAGWAANVLKQVQRDGAGVSVYSNRLEKA
jgi:hypothetical protein